MPLWSSVLQEIIKSTSERQRLAAALGVSVITLNRWAGGKSRPQRSHMIHLTQVIHPKHRQELIDALAEDFPDIQTLAFDPPIQHVSSDFFAQILRLLTTTTESLRFWRIGDVILKQALAMLDPNQSGVAVRLIQCMPPWPNDGKVHSLRECTGYGTPPWTADLEHNVVFLGMESLSGYVVETRYSMNDNDVRQFKDYPVVIDEYEVSAAAYPIILEGGVAGCLLATSVQKDYFSQQRLALLSTFSHLLSLVFDEKEFYRADQIQLSVMPPPYEQRPHLAQFRQRVTERHQEAVAKGETLSHTEIEQLVWRELEHKMLNLPLSTPYTLNGHPSL